MLNQINSVSTRSALIFKVKYQNEIEYKMPLASQNAICQVSVSYFALKWLAGWNGRHMEWQERYLTGGNPQSILEGYAILSYEIRNLHFFVYKQRVYRNCITK